MAYDWMEEWQKKDPNSYGIRPPTPQPSRGLSDYRMPSRWQEGMSRMSGPEDMPGQDATNIAKVTGAGGAGAGLLGSLGIASSALGPIGAGLGAVSMIAGMIGRKKAEEEAEKEREKEEALRRAQWMSGRREQAVGRWS